MIFKNKILNLITAGFFFVAAILGFIGLLWVDALNYIGKGVYYLVAASSVIFTIINMIASFKKKNHKAGNITIIIASLLTMVLGLILFFHQLKVDKGNASVSSEDFFLNASRVLGLSCYIEGVMLILVCKFNEESHWARTLIGILILTFGVVTLVWLKDSYIAWTLEAILFLLGVYYLIAGLIKHPDPKDNKIQGPIDSQEASLEEKKDDKKEEEPETEKDKNEEIETNDVPQIENNSETNSIDDFFK